MDCMTSLLSVRGTSTCLALSSAMSPRRYRQMRPSSSSQLRRCCHSTCMSRLHTVEHSTGQLAPHKHCRSSQISRSACWAANNCSLKPWVASSAQSLAAWTAHAMPSTGAR
ncbi:hypothetical protein T03_16923 [Trichinella britovi]|uniref:Uncharacterized protein n=1 Tax=Trichinella britovi TaxID=45882 RepID=A0A0V1CBE7_TRIBR|nr:hypothetical protein T03_16923 [Trichinella britovi]